MDENPKSINEVLAENLGYFMRQKGLSPAALGKKAGMGQTTVSLYLRPKDRGAGSKGKEPSGKVAEVQRLADALEIEPWELLRPLTAAQRDFYRSMEALIAERTRAAAAPVEPQTHFGTPTAVTSEKRKRAA